MRKFIKSFTQFVVYQIIYRILKLLPLQKNKIIYIAHYGSQFGCNPKSMYDYIREHKPTYKNIIVQNDKAAWETDSTLNTQYVRYHSIGFLYELATSAYWVVNTNLNPKLKPRNHQVYLQTWHAAGAFKKFGNDLPLAAKDVKDAWKKDTSHWSKMICSSDSIVDIYSHACHISKNNIYPLGLPRNDIFYDEAKKMIVRKSFVEKYAIPEGKKIILYAPTYRDNGQVELNLDFDALKRELQDDYVFVLKLHPLVAGQAEGIENDGFIINCSFYRDIQELLLVSDVLITDYSSVIFDFALTGKPIVFYAYDLKQYDEEMRGFYFPYKEWVPGPIVYDQIALESTLKDYDRLVDEYFDKVNDFAKEYNADTSGKSTEMAVNLLLG